MTLGLRQVLTVVVLGGLAAACAGGGATPASCETEATCPSLSRCIEGACFANAPPLARFTSQGGVAAFALATFDGSGSFDPDDPLDAVTSHAWSFEAVDAPCPAPVVAGTGALAQVRFGCAGRFRVQLVVTDMKGAPSAPRTVELDVAPASQSAVQAGADLERPHACAGEPLVCRIEPAVVSAAIQGGAVAGDVTYRWTVQPPPDRPLSEARRVTFTPGADAADAEVVIETDATAISGDWVFRVEVMDAYGVVGAAAQRISVTNRPPTVTATVPVFQHTFDAAASTFSVASAITTLVVDPDGDPLERSVVWRHTGDDGALFDGLDLGDRISVQVLVPYAKPADAGRLIGPGVERSVELTVRDVNGAEVVNSWPVQVANRPPVPPASLAALTVGHTYASGTFTASGTLGQWVDPDGDPLFQGSGTGDAECTTVTAARDGKVQLACSAPYLSPVSLGNFATTHEVSVLMRDPWADATAARAATVTVTNRAPVFENVSVSIPIACSENWNVCCEREGSLCLDYRQVYGAGSTTLGQFAHDPDGDPFIATAVATTGSISVSPAATACAGNGSGCVFGVDALAFEACAGTLRSFRLSLDDGAAAAVQQLFVPNTPCQ